MAHWDDIHIRQQIELTIKTSKQTYTFGSIIVRKNDNEIYFRLPASQHSSTVIRRGTSAEVAVRTEQRTLKFTTEFGMIQPGTPPSVQILRPPEDKIQTESKEGFYELKVEVPLTYRLMRDLVTPVSEFKKGITETLSADECIIRTDKALIKDNFVELSLTLPGGEEVTFVGKVTSSEQLPDKTPPTFLSHIKYEVIRRGEQDKIMKFVFDRQRSLRKRGMY
ncbi:MAG: hypothetical protein AB1546_02355 [bacterium]